jgi:hypothetical protein
MLVMSFSCGNVLLYFMSKRESPSAWIVSTIFLATAVI